MPPRNNIHQLPSARAPRREQTPPPAADFLERVEARTHRTVRPIDPETLARLNGDDDAISAIRARLNGPARHMRLARPSLWERIAEHVGDRLLTIFVSFWAGSLFTAGMALLWAKVALP